MKKATDALVLTGSGNDLKLLVIKRKNPPFLDLFALPGGFIDAGEQALAACVRELAEETGVQLREADGIELSVRKRRGRDPRGDVRSYPFMFYCSQELQACAQDDALEAKWVLLTELKELAFDHGAILCEGLGHFWKTMPSFSDALEGLRLPDFMPVCEDSNIGVFYGGSFNPWHAGHTACVDNAPKNTIVVPDSNPWKSMDENIDRKCFWRSLLEICQQLAGRDITIFPGFWGAEQGNPTISWLSQTNFKQYALVMGDDAFLSLHQWFAAEKLIKILHKVYIIPRGASAAALLAQKKKIQGINGDLVCSFGKEHKFQELSSSNLRES